MNEIIEFARRVEKERAKEISKLCKAINTLIISIFFVMSAICAAKLIPELMMYAYMIVGGIALTVSTILLAVQEMKLTDNYDYEYYEEDSEE